MIRPLNRDLDAKATVEIMSAVISKGDTWVFDPASSQEELENIWFAADKQVYGYFEGETLAGIYFFKANQPGLGSHVANAGYMVHPAFRGKGIAEAMCWHSQKMAKEAGFMAMQFNIVIASNTVAIRLWEKCGFNKIGLLPKVFKGKAGYEDAWVMFKEL